MPDLPMNTVLPNSEAEVEAKIKWLNFLQGGGLAVLIAVIGLGASIVLFQVIMRDRDEDRKQMREEAVVSRQSDKEFREQMLKATVEHTTATVQQTAVQQKTNEGLEEVKDVLMEMGERIENLADNEAETAKRLDRMLEKAWNTARPQSGQEQPK